MPRTRDSITREIDELDIPFLPVTAAIQLVADYLEIDPIPALRRMRDGFRPISNDERVLTDLMEEAMESSFQIDHVLRNIDLEHELSQLPE